MVLRVKVSRSSTTGLTLWSSSDVTASIHLVDQQLHLVSNDEWGILETSREALSFEVIAIDLVDKDVEQLGNENSRRSQTSGQEDHFVYI